MATEPPKISVILTGPAASGKSEILKRVREGLEQKQPDVVWSQFVNGEVGHDTANKAGIAPGQVLLLAVRQTDYDTQFHRLISQYPGRHLIVHRPVLTGQSDEEELWLNTGKPEWLQARADEILKEINTILSAGTPAKSG